MAKQPSLKTKMKIELGKVYQNRTGKIKVKIIEIKTEPFEEYFDKCYPVKARNIENGDLHHYTSEGQFAHLYESSLDLDQELIEM